MPKGVAEEEKAEPKWRWTNVRSVARGERFYTEG